jgi:hypothetical protein
MQKLAYCLLYFSFVADRFMKDRVENVTLRVTVEYSETCLEHYTFKVLNKGKLGRYRWKDIWNEDGDCMMIGIRTGWET